VGGAVPVDGGGDQVDVVAVELGQGVEDGVVGGVGVEAGASQALES
jgi:hypothetical protein